jgi:hypothetical protein
MPLTNYSTIYTTVQDIVSYYLVSRYRVVSDIVTHLDVDYYDEKTNDFVTRITYPTRYLRGVNTILLGVETRTTGTPGRTPPHRQLQQHLPLELLFQQ